MLIGCDVFMIVYISFDYLYLVYCTWNNFVYSLHKPCPTFYKENIRLNKKQELYKYLHISMDIYTALSFIQRQLHIPTQQIVTKTYTTLKLFLNFYKYFHNFTNIYTILQLSKQTWFVCLVRSLNMIVTKSNVGATLGKSKRYKLPKEREALLNG